MVAKKTIRALTLPLCLAVAGCPRFKPDFYPVRVINSSKIAVEVVMAADDEKPSCTFASDCRVIPPGASEEIVGVFAPGSSNKIYIRRKGGGPLTYVDVPAEFAYHGTKDDVIEVDVGPLIAGVLKPQQIHGHGNHGSKTAH